MRPFSLLVKPASADCNLRCAYCFYLDRSRLYPETKVHRMSEDTLARMVSSYMSTEQPTYAFGWQGGEPTLMGADFFRRATDLQKKYGRKGAVVANGLQTNATMIDDDLARHLAEYKFLVGVSLDGPAEIHDHYRARASGRGSHADVLRGVDRLKRRGVEFNILTLVNDLNGARPREIYGYLRHSGFLFHQYIPCVEFDETGQALPFTISSEQWGDFLCAIYDEWIVSDTRLVSVRLFDSVLTRMVEGTHNVCHMGRDCRQYFVVEHNGDVYPCDFFVYKDLRLGDVFGDSWAELQRSPKYAEFGRLKAKWNAACEECEWLTFCSGDCLKHRFRTERDPRALSWLCKGWKQFYAHAIPGLRKLAAGIERERRQAQAAMGIRRQEPQRKAVGRNDPCPCGSGKKYKKCCMGRGVNE